MLYNIQQAENVTKEVRLSKYIGLQNSVRGGVADHIVAHGLFT